MGMTLMEVGIFTFCSSSNCKAKHPLSIMSIKYVAASRHTVKYTKPSQYPNTASNSAMPTPQNSGRQWAY